MATLDGQLVFGAAVSISHTPRAGAHQIAAFFGINGVLSSFGGSRGRAFMVEGCFYGESQFDCVAADAVMRSFADGVSHVLVDNLGRTWTDVIFRGEIQAQTKGPVPGSVAGDFAWVWPYKLVLEGLS